MLLFRVPILHGKAVFLNNGPCKHCNDGRSARQRDDSDRDDMGRVIVRAVQDEAHNVLAVRLARLRGLQVGETVGEGGEALNGRQDADGESIDVRVREQF